MKKSLITVLLVSALTASLVACGGGSQADAKAGSNAPAGADAKGTTAFEAPPTPGQSPAKK